MWSATWMSSWGCSASGVEGNNPQADFGIDLSRTEAPATAASVTGPGRSMQTIEIRHYVPLLRYRRPSPSLRE